MPVSVVVGGQFGSEGKGKVAHFFTKDMGAAVAVRVGGPNSGHTVINASGEAIVFKQLPTAAILPGVKCVIPAGSYIRSEILLEEIRIAGLSSDRLLIDPNAVLITDRELAEEGGSLLRSAIGSTQSGTGAAVVGRIARTRSVSLVSSCSELKPFICSTTPFLRDRLRRNERIIVEGTQGFGLSVLHSRFYPFATSRDTTAAAFISEAGLSPLDVDDVVVVIRAFPIRVSGNSGPLHRELSWEDITRDSGSPTRIAEYTSVTHKLRRVGEFDAGIVREAILYNRPTRVVLNHLDYVDATCAPANGMTQKALSFVRSVETGIGTKISHVGFDRRQIAQIDLSKHFRVA